MCDGTGDYGIEIINSQIVSVKQNVSSMCIPVNGGGKTRLYFGGMRIVI